MKITKAEFDKLYTDDISKKEYDAIISKIDERFQEICEVILPEKYAWYDYGNCEYDTEESGGCFDIHEYKSTISIGGDDAFLPEPYLGDGNCFPTRWLWEDFEDEFKTEVENSKLNRLKLKEAAKVKKQNLKNEMAKFKQLIKSKLTKEELKYISFKRP